MPRASLKSGEYNGVDPQARITLNGTTVTVSFTFDNAELAKECIAEMMDSYHNGEPVTITLSRPLQ